MRGHNEQRLDRPRGDAEGIPTHPPSLHQALSVMQRGSTVSQQQFLQAADDHAREHAQDRVRNRNGWGDDAMDQSSFEAREHMRSRRRTGNLRPQRLNSSNRNTSPSRNAGDGTPGGSPSPTLLVETSNDYGPHSNPFRRARNLRMMQLREWDNESDLMPRFNRVPRRFRNLGNLGRSLGDYVVSVVLAHLMRQSNHFN